MQLALAEGARRKGHSQAQGQDKRGGKNIARIWPVIVDKAQPERDA